MMMNKTLNELDSLVSLFRLKIKELVFKPLNDIVIPNIYPLTDYDRTILDTIENTFVLIP